jgi:hypothetical protein
VTTPETCRAVLDRNKLCELCIWLELYAAERNENCRGLLQCHWELRTCIHDFQRQGERSLEFSDVMPPGITVTVSESGYISSQLYTSVFNIFKRIVFCGHVILVFDGHCS